nr:hypothetical protein BaRGS_027453 [Batillaria attramentaria]
MPISPGHLQPVVVNAKSMTNITPGLFKVEYQGEGIVALCPKTHFCFGGPKGPKFSCKGLNKNLNDLTHDTYLQVLQTQTSGGGINQGIRTDGQAMLTYHTKSAKSLSYFYIKRQVQADGISTKPLLV